MALGVCQQNIHPCGENVCELQLIFAKLSMARHRAYPQSFGSVVSLVTTGQPTHQVDQTALVYYAYVVKWFTLNTLFSWMITIQHSKKERYGFVYGEVILFLWSIYERWGQFCLIRLLMTRFTQIICNN